MVPKAAIKIWTKGSALEGSEDLLSQVALLKKIEASYGACKSYEVIHSTRVSKTTKSVYLTINFELGSVFANLVFYNAPKGWIITNLDFNTEYDAIIPWQILYD